MAKRTTNEKAKVRFNTNDMLMPHARESRKNADEDSQLPAGDGREGKEQESTGCAASGGG